MIPPVPLFPYGADLGDSVLPMIDDISSPPIILDTPIFFFDNQESVIYVCIHFHMGSICVVNCTYYQSFR